MLAERVSPPWQFPVGKGYLLCRQKGNIEWLAASTILKKAKQEHAAVLDRAGKILSQLKNNESAKLTKKLAALAADSILPSAAEVTPLQATASARKLEAAQHKVDDIYWQARILRLMQNL